MSRISTLNQYYICRFLFNRINFYSIRTIWTQTRLEIKRMPPSRLSGKEWFYRVFTQSRPIKDAIQSFFDRELLPLTIWNISREEIIKWD